MKNIGKQPEVLARARKGKYYHIAKGEGDAGEVLNRYTLFALCLAAISAGLWGLACLSVIILEKGPIALLANFTAALMGR